MTCHLLTLKNTHFDHQDRTSLKNRLCVQSRFLWSQHEQQHEQHACAQKDPVGQSFNFSCAFMLNLKKCQSSTILHGSF